MIQTDRAQKGTHTLTQAQVDAVMAESKSLPADTERGHYRFLANRQAWRVETGEGLGVGTNVMYHPVYWDMPTVIAKKIATLTGTRAVKGD